MDTSKSEFAGDLLIVEKGKTTETTFFTSEPTSLRDAKTELEKLLRDYAPNTDSAKDPERFVINPVVKDEPEGSKKEKTDHITVFGERNSAVTFRKIPQHSQNPEMQRALKEGKQFMLTLTRLPKIAGK